MIRRSLCIALVTIALPVFSGIMAARNRKPLYKNPKAPVEQRVEDLLSRMTLDEKVCQIQNCFVETDTRLGEAFGGKSWGTVFTLKSDWEQCRDIMYNVQRYMLDSTRLGIPAIPCAEGLQGLLLNGCTIFPQALSQGSTFNPELVSRMAEACAEEAWDTGIRQVLSPVMEISRDPRWGRVEETYGEDPFLIAEMAVSFVKSYQSKGIACTPKHFIAHGSPTGGLNCASVSGGERELRGLYLYPFRRVLDEASPYCIMSCYSSYDGVPVTGSEYYMTDLLRGELGFDGYTYSDWGAVERLENYHFVAADLKEAARMALKAGVDLNVFWAYATLKEQVEQGVVDVSLIDRSVRRILKVKFELGLFEKPFGNLEGTTVRNAAHTALSKEISDESAILLENDGILPLDMSKYRRIAVVGPNSDVTIFGDYSWPDAGAPEGLSLLQGLRSRLTSGVELVHAEGCDWWSQSDSLFADAVRAAEGSDLVIAAVGSRSTFLTRKSLYNTSGEGNDLSSLDLPGRQMDLLKALKATGKPLIVVLISGKPFAMPWVKDNASAFLVQWYGGEMQGAALADILLGNVNPSGHLNISFPQSTGNIPCFYNYYKTDREYYGGHGGSYEHPLERYVFEKPYAAWNFGRGLSYSRFDYSSHRLDASDYSSEGTIRAEVEVRNDSDRDGKEVVQLYVQDIVSSVATPIQQLKAFRKVSIPARGKTIVRLEVPVKELSLVDRDLRTVVEPGQFEIQIGSASDCIHFRDTITVH